MADNELQFTAKADERVTSVLRARYAAPGDDTYWEGLQTTVMARIAGSARTSWLQVAAGWARPGLVAAAAVLIIAAALFQANRDEIESVTFASVAQPDPEFIYTEHDAASQREETLRLVMSH
ncbi:MAG TPA: hypothetical protein VMY38_01060 [Gemmatimonadaceae bacterium]|nr:hypothetical protein [Gemmatimonadaceae bacterium]